MQRLTTGVRWATFGSALAIAAVLATADGPTNATLRSTLAETALGQTIPDAELRKTAIAQAARELGVAESQVRVLSEARALYPLTGEQVYEAKVLAESNRELVSVSLALDGTPVNGAQKALSERAEHQKRYGKIDPDLSDAMARGAAEVAIPVLVLLTESPYKRPNADPPVGAPNGPGPGMAERLSPADRANEAARQAANQAHRAEHNRAVLRPIEQRLEALGITFEPLTVGLAALNVVADRASIMQIASWPEVASIGLDVRGDDDLNVSTATTQSLPLHAIGIRGDFVKAALIENRATVYSHPNLSLTQVTVCSSGFTSHATWLQVA